MLPTSYDKQTESSYCCIQPLPSQVDGITSLFALINTCSTLNFVCGLAICLLYHLQLHTRACAQWLHAQYSSSTADAMFVCIRMEMFRTCVILHMQIIYGLVSVGCECNFYTLRPYGVISTLMTSHQ